MKINLIRYALPGREGEKVKSRVFGRNLERNNVFYVSRELKQYIPRWVQLSRFLSTLLKLYNNPLDFRLDSGQYRLLCCDQETRTQMHARWNMSPFIKIIRDGA